MVMQHDDVVTRMKNVEMIELGLNKISPWYFSPYPQVKKIIIIKQVILLYCRFLVLLILRDMNTNSCVEFDKLLF